ncbi:hypothetical protein SLEP1_g41023 [Rubroshorea leprosula]|uniref:Uncharacterized protein n=1 Tax=Rubroshorea leprosula TaxID=152421 RepID=A0AAV5L6I1_9ROSI|nr:hypothetical protein SLEP1_g41023 [Rubroshorea leprosula]
MVLKRGNMFVSVGIYQVFKAKAICCLFVSFMLVVTKLNFFLKDNRWEGIKELKNKFEMLKNDSI